MIKKMLPMGAIDCDSPEGVCRVWWIATIEDKIYEAECRIPFVDAPGKSPIEKELNLEEILKNSKVLI